MTMIIKKIILLTTLFLTNQANSSDWFNAKNINPEFKQVLSQKLSPLNTEDQKSFKLFLRKLPPKQRHQLINFPNNLRFNTIAEFKHYQLEYILQDQKYAQQRTTKTQFSTRDDSKPMSLSESEYWKENLMSKATKTPTSLSEFEYWEEKQTSKATKRTQPLKKRNKIAQQRRSKKQDLINKRNLKKKRIREGTWIE